MIRDSQSQKYTNIWSKVASCKGIILSKRPLLLSALNHWHKGCLLGGLGIFPPSLQGDITNPPSDQTSVLPGKSPAKGERWCRSHKSPEGGSQLLTVSKVLSQQGPTGCINSSANWKQKRKQIQANISKTTPYTDTFQVGAVSNADNSWESVSGCSTPGKVKGSSTAPPVCCPGQEKAEKPKEEGWTQKKS